MNGPIWLIWILVALITIISVVLLIGKGSFLIAGYNMASKEVKAKYNEKRLCRVMGSGLSVVTILIAISAYYEFDLHPAISWFWPWGLFGIIVIVLILGNTICRESISSKLTDI